MDKNTARQLIKKTFQNPFDKDSFVYFVKNLLNYIEEAPFIYRGNFIPDAFDPYVKTLERIGKYQDPEDKEIDILIVRLKKESSLEHARTMQRNFVAWYLNGSRGGKLKDAALVAFIAPNGKDWRFSLVKMEYKLAKTQTGRVRAKEELTPARRYSFLVGIHESSHTAQSRLVPILEDDVNNPTLKQLEESFNIEKVTKEFFEKYRNLYHWIKEELDAIVSKNPAIKKDFNEKSISTVDFAKKLLGQIIFLYFLQKKGWFGVKRGENWGMGSKRFLRELFEKKHGDYKNFFNEILEPLFYEALRLERPGDYYSRFDCRIPFLNGGLFDPINDYDWWNTDILLPNDLFSNEIKTKEGDIGTGVLDIFDRYNFTVKEDEPLEKEVAVDPEMLGKVFENLLEVKDRKSKGTYYTPREIVHYMCQESLVNYLTTELDDKKISKKDIEALIKYGETTIEHDTIYIEKKSKKEKTKVYGKAKLPNSIEKNAKIIDERLATIRVCDPAVGSGAFLVGMMNKIIHTRNALTPYFKNKKERIMYNFKRHAIQDCLYGVDIDAGAVEIAKLRLWLSLVVDEGDRKQIKPLPNLDYKIMQGNSLIELLSGEFLVTSIDQRRAELVNKLKKSKDELFDLASPSRKEQKRQEINELIEEIFEYDKNLIIDDLKQRIKGIQNQGRLFRDAKFETEDKKRVEEIEDRIKEFQKIKIPGPSEHFEWHINFSEVFQEKDGFDIVIGNPPYLSAIQDSKNEAVPREIYRQKYPLIKGAFDIYVIFLIKGVEITHKRGSFSWIVPNKLLVTSYAKDVLRFLKDNGLYTMISVSFIKVFEASVYPILIFGNKLMSTFNEYEVESLERLAAGEIKQRVEFFKGYTTFKVANIKVASGATGFQAKQLINYLNDTSSKDTIPFIVSGSIDPYAIDFKNVRYMGRVYKKAFIKKGKGIADSKWNFWKKEKIIIAGMTKRVEATYISESMALGVGVYAIYDYGEYNPKFLLALLNSKFMTFYLNHKFKEKHLAGGYLAINKSTIEELPIISANINKQEPVIKIVDKILTVTKTDDYLENSAKQAKVHDYEKQIDQMVYKLYGLTKEEIKIIEGK